MLSLDGESGGMCQAIGETSGLHRTPNSISPAVYNQSRLCLSDLDQPTLPFGSAGPDASFRVSRPSTSQAGFRLAAITLGSPARHACEHTEGGMAFVLTRDLPTATTLGLVFCYSSLGHVGWQPIRNPLVAQGKERDLNP